MTGNTFTTELDVPVPMRDGTVLRADVSRPVGMAQVPVVLIRSPYPLVGARTEVDVVEVVSRGMALVVQSVRGTGASEGVFEPWTAEALDGADTVAWCAGQAWSTGRVGMIGRSYLAHTQLFAAAEAPPGLVAMCPGVAPGDPYDLTYTNGVLDLGSTLYWALLMAGSAVARAAAAGHDVQSDQRELAHLLTDLHRTYRTAPLRDIPVLAAHLPDWARWLDHPAHDDWWRVRDLGPRPLLPSFFVAGWHDLFLAGSLHEHEKSASAADHLVVGPWGHAASSGALGDVDYGFQASAATTGLLQRQLDFLAGHLHGRPSAPEAAPVSVFVTGVDRWEQVPQWPPPDTERRFLHLQPGGQLTEDPAPRRADSSRFVHDPDDPVPTLGGATLTAGAEVGFHVGSCDQRPLDARTDVLRFRTDPLTGPLEVAGTVRVVLHATTSAHDTDWTAKLVDVHPDGTALSIVDSIARVSHLEQADHRDQPLPGRMHRAAFDVGAVHHVFRPGHRVRLDVSSSNFPRFDRNPGTGQSMATTPAQDFLVAEQLVHHDHEHRSRLDLPIVVPTRHDLLGDRCLPSTMTV